MERMITSVGFSSVEEYFIKLVLPIIGITVGMYFFMLIFLKNLPFFIPYIILVLGISFVFAYPYILFERKKTTIHESIHLFITYLGTISTLNISRSVLFSKLSQKKDFGEISKITEKILYFSKGWNLGFAKTCRKVARMSPSKILEDFLDRFAVALDFGEELEAFLVNEQDSLMDDFQNTYQQALENIKTFQEIFLAMTVAFAFGMATSLMLPLLIGTPMGTLIKYAFLALMIMDGILVIMILAFVPSDRICHSLPVKDEGMKKTEKWFYILTPVSASIIFALLYMDKLPFLVNIAIGMTPMLYVGMLATNEEETVFKRDNAFPIFVRAFAGAMSVTRGGILGSLGSLQVHNFGILDDLVTSIYRRLKLGCERFKSWLMFAGESGSNLINYFIKIMVETMYMGGKAEVIGKIINKNFTRLLSLRKLRLQLASGLRGALYGAMIGFVATIYISAAITSLLANIFGGAFDATRLEGTIGSIVSSIIPAIPEVDMELISLYIGVMVIVHAFASAWIVKIVDGGYQYALFFDLVLLLWVGAILSVAVPHGIDSLFSHLYTSPPA